MPIQEGEVKCILTDDHPAVRRETILKVVFSVFHHGTVARMIPVLGACFCKMIVRDHSRHFGRPLLKRRQRRIYGVNERR